MVEVAREGLFILRLKQRYQSPSYPLKKNNREVPTLFSCCILMSLASRLLPGEM